MHHRRSSPTLILAWLIEHFGKSHGAWMHEAANGTRRPAGGDVQRAQIDQPRDDVRARPPSGARPRGAVADLYRALRQGR